MVFAKWVGRGRKCAKVIASLQIVAKKVRA